MMTTQMMGGVHGGGMSSSGYSYSSSSSSGGGGMSMGGGGGGVSMSSSSMSMSGAGGAGGVAFARKTNVSRSTAAASGNSMMMALSALGGGSASYAGTHELATNPKSVIERQVREKRDINNLNVKLAEYIESNGYYRIKVKEQEKLIIKMKGEFESIEARLRQIYDVEMAQLRATIDATAKEKAHVELKVDTLETLYKDFRAKYEAELSAHESTRSRLPKLEKEVSEKEAQIDFLAKTLASLEPQVSALKSQISTYQKETIDARLGCDAEIVRRVELESKLVTKDDEIAFIKKVYEEKLRMALDFDFDSEASYSNDLAEALRDIRAEYQAQLEAVRGDSDDSWIQGKISQMLQAGQKTNQELVMAREETLKYKTRVTEMSGSFSSLQAEIAALKIQLGEKDAEFQQQMTIHAAAIDEREIMIKNQKKELAALMMEMKGLLDIKLSLDAEIGEYRRLLLTGGGAAEVTVTGGSSSYTTTTVGGGSMSGSMSNISAQSTSVQQSSASSSVSQSVAKTSFAAMSKGRGAISETATDGRFITVENKSGQALDLGGWAIERCVDNGELVVFKFAAGTVLNGFGSLKLWANGVAGATSGAGNLIWNGGSTWGIGFNATNELKNASGVLEASLTQRTSLG
jgi:hypothetical protein